MQFAQGELASALRCFLLFAFSIKKQRIARTNDNINILSLKLSITFSDYTITLLNCQIQIVLAYVLMTV